MNALESKNDSPANILCKSCGLCCTGHLFAWTKLRSAELDSIQSLGLKVVREPEQRGFNQPCPLWSDLCTIYESHQYPRFCQTYKCKLLKRLIGENISLPESLSIVQNATERIKELESHLPVSPNPNFRERIIAYMENGDSDLKFCRKAKALLEFLGVQFGVKDFLS